MAGLGPGLAHADPNQTCTAPQWVTDMGIPIGSRTMCPDVLRRLQNEANAARGPS
jgi:hypothetical protein